jgi:predicted RNase H-like HicB family nuclease
MHRVVYIDFARSGGKMHAEVMRMRYNTTIAIQQEDDWFVAKCLRTNVASHGKSIEEAMAMVREALELYYEDEEDVVMPPSPFITTLEFAV